MLSASCAKIDKFETPAMLEGFTGICKVTPGIAGITANTHTPCLVAYNSNKTGSEVILSGPMTENFSLYSIFPDGSENKDLFRSMMTEKGVSELDKLDFSGFRAKVDPKSGNKIVFYDFGSQSDGMKLFKWKVHGEGVIEGPDTVVTVNISTTVGVLQELLPEAILTQLGTEESGLSLAEIEDKDTVVYLAQIDILAQALTFAY